MKNILPSIHAETAVCVGEGLMLIRDGHGLSLDGYGMHYQGDFEQMLPRIRPGRLQQEMLVHITKTKTPHPLAVDATAGMGEDALLLAASGYEVFMYEQNPVIAALLEDAMKRALPHPVLGEMMQRMHLVKGNSLEELPRLKRRPDVIYLDPMFPARQKSGLIGKKLQLLQRLEQPCVDEASLLEAAMLTGARKIVIKRPLKGPALAGKTPDYSVRGKSIRYDCLLAAQCSTNNETGGNAKD